VIARREAIYTAFNQVVRLSKGDWFYCFPFSFSPYVSLALPGYQLLFFSPIAMTNMISPVLSANQSKEPCYKKIGGNPMDCPSKQAGYCRLKDKTKNYFKTFGCYYTILRDYGSRKRSPISSVSTL
jgi:hypothetical protein